MPLSPLSSDAMNMYKEGCHDQFSRWVSLHAIAPSWTVRSYEESASNIKRIFSKAAEKEGMSANDMKDSVLVVENYFTKTEEARELFAAFAAFAQKTFSYRIKKQEDDSFCGTLGKWREAERETLEKVLKREWGNDSYSLSMFSKNINKYFDEVLKSPPSQKPVVENKAILKGWGSSLS